MMEKPATLKDILVYLGMGTVFIPFTAAFCTPIPWLILSAVGVSSLTWNGLFRTWASFTAIGYILATLGVLMILKDHLFSSTATSPVSEKKAIDFISAGQGS
jgi:hypothetical protein